MIRVDGVEYEIPDRSPLIELLREIYPDFPSICYHPQLGTIGTCDLCFVAVDGAPARACEVSAADGQEIITNSIALRETRKQAAGRILANHELYCTICDNNNGDCLVHETMDRLVQEGISADFKSKPYEVDDSNPFYRYDPSQCILCGRCVQACQELQVNETLSIDWSLETPRVVWDGGVPAGESSCVSCGHCVTVCPCNALMEKSMLGSAGLLTSMPDLLKEPLINLTKATEPSIGLSPIFTLSNAESVLRQGLNKRTKTVCTYCGVGCSFDVLTRGRHILKIQPEHGPANGVSTCVKGKFAWEFVNASDRLRTPFIRDGGKFRRASFEEAFDYIAQRLKEIEANSGPDAIGVIASSKCTNEEAYLAQKLARAVIGTNNVDNCSRYCQSPATMGLWRTVGYGGDSGSIRDLELAKLVLIIGSNTAESHPVIATRIKRSHKQGRSRLIVADLRSHEMAERADLFIRPRPGTDLVWLSAVTKLLIDRGSYAKEFVDKRVIGFDEYVRSIERYDLDYASTVCGLPASLLEQLADEIESADSMAICWAMGVTQHAGGSDTSTAISNLLLITGNYGRPGTGAYPLRGHNNVQGASDFGAMPTYMPGYEPVADEAVMNKWERAWGVPLPRSKGLDNHQMVEAIHEGKLRALLLTGEEMGLVDANALYVQEAFSKLEFFVVQDIFFSQTARFADVVLPASPSLEKSGTFTNTERRIQRLYRVFEPLAGSLPDWQITQGIANALGANWSYSDPSEIMDEVARTAEIFRGVTYDRLRGYASLQWPVDENGTDSPLLYTDSFHFPDGKARLFPLEWQEPSEQTDDEFDLHLNNGRLLEHFHEGNMTYRVSGISETTPEPFVEVSSELARERKLTTGTLVRLISRRGSIKVRVVVTDRVHGNQLYLPLNSRTNESAVNVLTSSATDRATDTPAYKELAVRMEVLPNEIAVPLPRRNFRFGTRTPQRGVKVDEKRKRSDYVEPWAGKIFGR